MLTLEEITGIIERRAWTELIGKHEGSFIDCKLRGYALATETGKQDLAKDATSFANAGGGYILIGLKTRKSKSHVTELIESLRPFQLQHFERGQYENVLRDWVFPPIKGLDISWRPEQENGQVGFGVILVPPQSSVDRPFLVAKTVLDSNRRTEVLFGYCERQQDSNRPLKRDEIHRVFRDGLQYDSLMSSRLDGIERQVAELCASVGEGVVGLEEDWSERFDALIQDVLKTVGLEDSGRIVLSAFPVRPLRFEGFLRSGETSIKHLLEDPPTIEGRESGFYVGGGRAVLHEAASWSVEGLMGHLELFREGLLIWCAGVEGLCWGPDRSRIINTLLLVEAIHSFCVIYGRLLERGEIALDELLLSLRLEVDLRDEELILVPHSVRKHKFKFEHDSIQPKQPSFIEEIKLHGAEFDPSRVAYQVVQRFFARFGARPDSIPYGIDEEERIDPDKFLDQ